MSLPSLLMLALLLTAPLAATDNAPPGQSQTDDLLASQTSAAQQPRALLTPQSNRDFDGESDGICYKIRAYIFKRDDDHAPELAGTTTCGPRQPHAKNVVWPKARLVPAD
jgi:hypothetical protein